MTDESPKPNSETALTVFDRNGIICRIDQGIAELSLGWEPLNVFDRESMAAMLEAIAILAQGDSLRALVIRSNLRVFSAGVDVESHRGTAARPTLQLFDRVIAAIEHFFAPTIAVVNGAALGGGLELALACDLRVIASEAKLALPETQLGVYPPYAMLRLPELVGRGVTARLVMTGDTIDGAEGHRIGLAEFGGPRAELPQIVDDLVREYHDAVAGLPRAS